MSCILGWSNPLSHICNLCYFAQGCACKCTETNTKKSSLGIIPKEIWISKRIEELVGAMNRFAEAGMSIDPKWIEEYNELVSDQ